MRQKPPPAADRPVEKRPFDVREALAKVREAVKPYPKAAMFELAARGHASVFALLAGCIISIRTRDEVTLPTTLRLLARAGTPAEGAALAVDEIGGLIHDCAFHEAKARQIRDIARVAVEQHGGELPADRAVLLGLHGVGPKCANLVLGALGVESLISVDVHVHRITNRWGYVRTRSPEQTMRALEQALPRDYWVEINALLVPFGKHVCLITLPRCSSCPVLTMCRQVGVTRHR